MTTAHQQTRGHSHGHGHGHHHHSHDNTYLLSSNKKDAGVRITRIGLYVNLGMAVSKGVGGYVFNSQGRTSLTDLVSDIMTLATVSWSLKPPSERFPTGYGKVESLGSLGVSGILLGGGFMMGWAALIAICQQFFPEAAHVAAHWGLLPHSHGHHHHGADDLGPNINAAWLAGGSILIKEWLYRATLKIAKERKSSVLASNAYHHRVDSLTAFVALLMIAGSNVLNNASWLDPVGGLVISLMVVQAGWGNTKAALYELADVGVEEEMQDNVRKATNKALDTINVESTADKVEIRSVQGVKSGQNYLMDVELAAPGSWSIEQARSVEDLVRERVGAKVRGVKRLRVRFISQSSDQSNYLDEFINMGPSATATPEPETDEHEHSHANGHDHSHNTTNGDVKRRK
ncbi:cation efflux family-domain-containing protein [Dendryphion nanum]|uniref:Cation efflux family-domain-containing protein n=1 Tax=Dendryphion nanum TaxID=256645 RepID=A0A9P9CXZ8_9PLEO|nr:cation efflux family-domain-containing protein [Dendryphion nanum]